MQCLCRSLAWSLILLQFDYDDVPFAIQAQQVNATESGLYLPSDNEQFGVENGDVALDPVLLEPFSRFRATWGNSDRSLP